MSRIFFCIALNGMQLITDGFGLGDKLFSS